jgi:hypothetical protein
LAAVPHLSWLFFAILSNGGHPVLSGFVFLARLVEPACKDREKTGENGFHYNGQHIETVF